MTTHEGTPHQTPTIHNELEYLRLGWLHVHQVSEWVSTESLTEWCRQVAAESIQPEHLTQQESLREGVRAMLRRGGYKPSGRNKPAQEYLQRCIREGTGLPVILPAVDVLNAVSIRVGLPISMLGSRYFPDAMRVRIGAPGESFVFNSAGQTLEVEGLIVVCGGQDGQHPLGSPVKDSMAGKINSQDHSLSCLIYAPASIVTVGEMEGMVETLAKNLEKWAGAKRISAGTA